MASSLLYNETPYFPAQFRFPCCLGKLVIDPLRSCSLPSLLLFLFFFFLGGGRSVQPRFSSELCVRFDSAPSVEGFKNGNWCGGGGDAQL